MNLNFVPTLQHLTLPKIAVALCNHSSVKAVLTEGKGLDPHVKFYVIEDGNYFSTMERVIHPMYVNDGPSEPHHDTDLMKRVQDKASGMFSPLKLGTSLEKQILHFIPNIVLEIEKWENDHSEVLPAGYEAQVYFMWKSDGTIDRERTAENLLNHGNLSVKHQFFLACLYCMQNRLPSLWDSIYDSYKAHLISKCHSGSLLNYWTTRLDGLHSRRFVFPDASYITNASALQYFYNKCCSEDQKRALVNDVLKINWKNLDLISFCITKLCQNGYGELSSLECHSILKSLFFNWQLQGILLDVWEHLLVMLGQVGINDFLRDILGIIVAHQYDTEYLDLVKLLWKLTPFHHKESLMNTLDFQPVQIALHQTSVKSLTVEWCRQ